MSEDSLPIKEVHHIEIIAGNAKQASYYYRKGFGFDQIAYLGPETGFKDRASYVLAQGKIRLVLTTPLKPNHLLSEHIKLHGDGVKDIAFTVDDVDRCFQQVVKRGAEVVLEPTNFTDKKGSIRKAVIKTYGDTVHSFISRKDYDGIFLPGYEKDKKEGNGVGVYFVDHIVGNVEDGKMDQWADWHIKILGFYQFLSFDDKDISTEYSALRSKVMSNETGSIKFPINEPAQALRKSQIQEYIDFYITAGVQHIALLTDNIIDTVSRLKTNGIEFLDIPDVYYDTIWDRVGEIEEDREKIRKLKILVDRDENGYLLQLFTKPVEDRPTLFFEVIQRKGASGFGKGNFKALFEAIEREQANRGNL